MDKNIQVELQIEKYADKVKLTPLRKDVLSVLILSKKSMSAYEILNQLKKSRISAEPPTVYRVLDYFIDKNIVHRIDTENRYVLCSYEKGHNHTFGLLFVCKKCMNSFEVIEPAVFQQLKKISKNHLFFMDDALMEIKGYCSCCHSTRLCL